MHSRIWPACGSVYYTVCSYSLISLDSSCPACITTMATTLSLPTSMSTTSFPPTQTIKFTRGSVTPSTVTLTTSDGSVIPSASGSVALTTSGSMTPIASTSGSMTPIASTSTSGSVTTRHAQSGKHMHAPTVQAVTLIYLHSYRFRCDNYDCCCYNSCSNSFNIGYEYI